MPRRKKRRPPEEPAPSPLEGLAPPPRPVSGPLQVRLRLNALVLLAGLLFGLAAVPLPSLLASDALLLPWRDPPHWETARGELTAVHEHRERGRGRSRGGQLSYEYHYSFRLPDGTARQGHSHSGSQRYTMPTRKGGKPQPPPAVTIEYDPARPERNRLQGTSMYFPPPWAFICLILGGVGLLLAACGLAWGGRRVRLLRDGELVWATLTTVHTQRGKQQIVEPVETFKNRCFAQVEQTRSGHESKVAVGCGVIFGLFLSGIVGFVAAFGAVVLVHLIAWLIDGGDVPGWGLATVGLGTFAVVTALTMTGLVRRQRREWSKPVEELVRGSFGRCSVSYAFELPDGETVQSRDTTRLTASRDPEPPQPVLYDPLKPSRSLLVLGLRPPVTVGGEGTWEASGLRMPLRVALAGLGFVAGPLLGLLLLGR